MNRYLFLFLLCFYACANSYSQSDCKCTDVLNQVINKVENEYPGFPDKTKDFSVYTSFKNSLIDSIKTSSSANCDGYLKQYINLFKDGHLVLNIKNPKNVSAQNKSETFDFEINDFKNYLAGSKNVYEGIWNSGGYKVGIKKQGNGFTGFIINSENKSWKEKEVKFKLNEDGNAAYFRGDHSVINSAYKIYNDCIVYFEASGASYVKEFPEPGIMKDSINKCLNEIEGFYIKSLSDKTLLFKIASFDYSNTDRIKELISSNKILLGKSENLIIDVRGNGGGTDYCYKPLLPYIYTNPVRYLSGEYLVSQTLIDGLENWANTADTSKEADEILSVRKDIARMKLNLGKFIPYSEDGKFGFTKQDTVYTYPKNVIILTDKRCGSSTEKFILDAKQSKKVKIFGTPTYGAVDYVSLREFKIDCPDYSLYMPTVRMLRLPDYPIDNIGIQPDVYLDKYLDDWVEYAKDYLEN